MRFHVRQGEPQDGRQRRIGCRAEREVVGLEVADRLVAGNGPAHEQQRGAEAPGGIGIVVDKRGNGVRCAITAAERRGALVNPQIPTQRPIVLTQRRRNDSRTTFPRMNPIFAGRSARRRIRYGYQ